MKIELTPDEVSLLTGMLVIWRQRVRHTRYEKMLIDAILHKIFERDKEAVEKILVDKKR